MGIYSNDYQTTLGDTSNSLRLSGIYGNSAYDALYSANPAEPGLFNLLGALVTKGTDSMKDNLRTSLKDRAITPYADDLTKLTAMKDKTGDSQFLKNNMASNLSGLEDWLLDARRDKGINTAIDTVNTNEGASWLDNYKASVSGMPVNDVLHGAKNLDSLYDLAGKGRTGGEMLNVKESANKAVQNQLTDMLKPEIQSAVDDAALRGEILTPAAIINSGSPIIRDMLTTLGVDPRIANNRQIIDPVRDLLFTQYSKVVGPDGALKPEDVKTWESKNYTNNKLNTAIQNNTDYNVNGVLSSQSEAELISTFGSKEAATNYVTQRMRMKFLQDPIILEFKEKLLDRDQNYMFSPKFNQSLARAAEFDRINGTSGDNSMVTLLTGQPNYIKHLDTIAKLLQSDSEENRVKRDYLFEGQNFYQNQVNDVFNLTGKTYLNNVTESCLSDMKKTVNNLAGALGVKLNSDLLDKTVEYYANVLDKDGITFRNVDAPALKGIGSVKQKRVRDRLEMYLLGMNKPINSSLTK